MITCYTHSLSFHGGLFHLGDSVLFPCFIDSCWSSILNLSSFFHILYCLFYCLSPYFPNFHILLHCLFFLLNNNLFSSSHWSTNMLTRETGAFTVSCALPWYDFSTILLYKFLLHVTHTNLFFFRGVPASEISWTLSVSSLLHYSFKSFMSFCCS